MKGQVQRTLVVGAALVADGLVLAARRRNPAGFWEFPGGKCEPGEEPTAALQRELAEELGCRAEIGPEVVPPAAGDPASGTWPINQVLHLRVWLARPVGVPTAGPDHDQLRWLNPADLSSLQWLPADVPIAARLAQLLAGDPVVIAWLAA